MVLFLNDQGNVPWKIHVVSARLYFSQMLLNPEMLALVVITCF